MAFVYRKPTADHHEAAERWQTTAGMIAGLFLLALLFGGGFLLADTTVPPQHLPWKPLRLADPVGAATAPKVSTAAAQACRNVLANGGVSFQEVPASTEGEFCSVQDAVFINGGATRLKPTGAVMTCGEALAYAIWDRQVVQPAAMAMFGQAVTAMDHYGSYSCRRRYGKTDTVVSEHAYANALDIGAFHLADGRVISVERDWSVPGLESVFLHRVRDGGCRVFKLVLSPDYNEAHKNHLHLDMGRTSSCD